MRVEKGLNSPKIEKITEKVTERVFQKIKPDEFVKTCEKNNTDNIKTKLGKVVKTTLAATGLGLGANSLNNLKNNNDFDIDKYLQETYDAENKKIEDGLKNLNMNEKAINKFMQNHLDQTFVLNEEKINVMKLAKDEFPDFFKYMCSYPDRINDISYEKGSALTNFINISKIKIGNKSLVFQTNDNGKIFAKILISSDKNGIKTTKRYDLQQDTGDYILTTTLSKKNHNLNKKTETQVVTNNVGLINKLTTETLYDKSGKPSVVKKSGLDGSVEISTYKYNADKLPVEQIINEYSNGVLNAKTTIKTNYKVYQESEFSMPEYIPAKTITSIDYKNNVTSEITTDGDFDILQKEVRQIKNPNNGKITTEIIEKSDIAGVFNSKIIDENGNEKIESFAKKYPDGSVKIEKHFVSLDGTKTDYVYKSTPDKNLNRFDIVDKDGIVLATNKNNIENKVVNIEGKNGEILLKVNTDKPVLTKDNYLSQSNIEMSYKITDKDGKVLTTVDRTFEKVNDNLAYSSLNGHKYSIKNSDNGLTITDLKTNKITKVNYNELISSAEDFDVAINFVKTIPADMILNLVEKGLTIDLTNDLSSSVYFTGLSVIVPDNMYVFAHESGHAKDYKIQGKVEDLKDILNSETEKVLTKNKEFRTIYEKEKAEFMKSFPYAQKKYIDYFIDELYAQTGVDYSPAEVIAETNALFSTGIAANEISVRSHYLQKYFPQTIAYLSKLINPNTNIADAQ